MITASALDWVLWGGLIWLWITGGMIALMILIGVCITVRGWFSRPDEETPGNRRYWGS